MKKKHITPLVSQREGLYNYDYRLEIAAAYLFQLQISKKTIFKIKPIMKRIFDIISNVFPFSLTSLLIILL